ncbi:MAG: DUF4238 domain-containing protein [Planctomycetota bacterium]
MSGKRQHFIPRFLQEGFASHRIGDEVYTWVYRKGSRPFNANITKVGVEGQFYVQGADTSVDDLITDAEARFSTVVRDLRTGVPPTVVQPELPRLLAHLEVRTRHLRQCFLQAAGFLVSLAHAARRGCRGVAGERRPAWQRASKRVAPPNSLPGGAGPKAPFELPAGGASRRGGRAPHASHRSSHATRHSA